MTRSPIAALRDVVPIRPLTRNEAFAVAERQSRMLHQLVGSTAPPFADRHITELARVHVEHVSPWPTSGATHWVNGQWVIVLNAAEPAVRQRFSLAHELKHILDHRFIDVIYNDIPGPERADFVEQICDYFAGAVLMPRPWLERAWDDGTRNAFALARQFNVSHAVMRMRLTQIGLASPTPRCSRPPRHWAIESIKTAGGRSLYRRSTTPIFDPQEQT